MGSPFAGPPNNAQDCQNRGSECKKYSGNCCSRKVNEVEEEEDHRYSQAEEVTKVVSKLKWKKGKKEGDKNIASTGLAGRQADPTPQVLGPSSQISGLEPRAFWSRVSSLLVSGLEPFGLGSRAFWSRVSNLEPRTFGLGPQA